MYHYSVSPKGSILSNSIKNRKWTLMESSELVEMSLHKLICMYLYSSRTFGHVVLCSRHPEDNV